MNHVTVWHMRLLALCSINPLFFMPAVAQHAPAKIRPEFAAKHVGEDCVKLDNGKVICFPAEPQTSGGGCGTSGACGGNNRPQSSLPETDFRNAARIDPGSVKEAGKINLKERAVSAK